MKKILSFVFLLALFISCTKVQVNYEVVEKNQEAREIVPVDFPYTGIKSFNFPEDPDVINSWLGFPDSLSVARHAWGIWAGLTTKTGQTYKGQDLYVYDTWYGVQELSDAVGNMDTNAGCLKAKNSRTVLSKPKQFAHAGFQAEPSIDTDYRILETVAYSPDAACFASQGLVFNQSTLNKYLVKGEVGKIPDFPNTSITTKPTYYVVKASSGLARLPVWTTTPVPAKVFGNKLWNHFVYVDLENKQAPNKKLVPVIGDAPTQDQIAAATCNASDFLYFRLDDDAAAYLNMQQDKGTDPAHQFQAGDVALLVAMHVTTKEIPNWTWQTYFWAPDPYYPGQPSNEFYAAMKPKEITGAAAHYAVSPCYAMVYPNQPITGGTDKGAFPIICYNPYLEAGFGPSVFQFKNTYNPDFQYGVQTNCPACHALATSSGKLGYSTDQYIDMLNPVFKDDVQLDFAWSIQGNINSDK
jgi:hypothetical protein